MQNAINIEAPSVDAEAGAAVAGAIAEILRVGAENRISDTVMLAAFQTMRETMPKAPSSFTVSGCHIDGGDRVQN